jgi:hypothetical protein
MNRVNNQIALARGGGQGIKPNNIYNKNYSQEVVK